jgi:hypothetical protein
MMTPEDVRVRKGWLDRAGNGTALERFRVHLVRVSLEADRRDAELLRQVAQLSGAARRRYVLWTMVELGSSDGSIERAIRFALTYCV